MNQEQFNNHLGNQATSEVQGKIVQMLMNHMQRSASEMGNYHDNWELADRVYRGYRRLDKKDEDAVKKGEPPKVIIPVSYALTQTALSFLMTTLFGDDRLFKLRGIGPEDQRIKEAYELDINYQASKELAYSKFYLWLQDTFKYGIGIVEDCWETDHKTFRTQKQVPVQVNPLTKIMSSMFGGASGEEVTMETIETTQKLKTFEGTRLRNVSPYCFYPDPNVPIAQFQKGAFVACEDETTLAEITSKEGSLYFGAKHIPSSLPSELLNARTRRVGSSTVFKGKGTGIGIMHDDIKMGNTVIKIRFEFVTTPKQLKEDYEYDLGPEFPKNEPLKMVAVVANEQKLIKFEPLGYLHDKYSFNVIEYSPDHNNFVNPGLGETIYNLQDTMTWFLNSHVQNVRKAIRNRIIGDPDRIHVEDLTSGKEFVRTKALAGRSIKDALYSFEINDITRSHVSDIQVLNSLVQITTGINENTLGQYSSGRRSASEARAVSSSASARLKMHGMLAWTQGFEPLAQKMISNTNQLRSEEYYNKMLGEQVSKYPYQQTIVIDPSIIANGFNFIAYDGSLPSDKEREAQHFTNLMEAILKNPQEMVGLTQISIGKVLEHIFSLYGIKNFEDFKLNPQQMQQGLEASIMPDAMLEQLRQQGQVQQTSTPDDLIRGLSQ